MLTIDSVLAKKYEILLVQEGIPINQRCYFYKWLRYYLDYCDKYQLEPSEQQNFSFFDKKLHSKNQ